MFKFEVETLPGRKRCFEKRCKGTQYFMNFQTFWDFFCTFVAKLRFIWKLRKQNLH